MNQAPGSPPKRKYVVKTYRENECSSEEEEEEEDYRQGTQPFLRPKLLLVPRWAKDGEGGGGSTRRERSLFLQHVTRRLSSSPKLRSGHDKFLAHNLLPLRRNYTWPLSSTILPQSSPSFLINIRIPCETHAFPRKTLLSPLLSLFSSHRV